ncbi:neuronal PAS domain-containing protein 4-like isoform X1 [Cuculus canorus]|uniref:neuronal PAS domain-containing protein 4-like isoform X1 n=1 Tax=Cuculus canorus TaxID=55661 RepID=UPI0023AA517F|nr:neuronal PAS domain-containing protein 4-like isoform X1 [Cuculus canorus]
MERSTKSALQVNQRCLQGSPGPDQCGAAGAALPAAHLRAGEGAAVLPPHHGPGVPPAAGSSAIPSRYGDTALHGSLLLSQDSTSPHAPLADSTPCTAPVLSTELLSLLPGFLLVLLADGKLVYISENVAQVLGLSMVELLAHGDTVFDILDGQACEEARKKLLLAWEEPGREVTFVSEMRTSKAFRMQHGGNRAVAVCGRFMAPRWPPSPSSMAFLALCTPVAQFPADSSAGSQDDLFQSTHFLDMTFADVTESVTYHLGYCREELIGQSWYSLLHPEDTDRAAAQHRAVAPGGGGCAPAVLRVLRRDGRWAWLRVCARRDGGAIVCSSRCLRDEEAAFLLARQRRPAPPAAPELSLLAAQLRALADSLAPPPAAPGTRTFPHHGDISALTSQ